MSLNEYSFNDENDQFDLATALKQLYASIREKELQYTFLLEKIHPSQKASAINLLHNLYLRSINPELLQKCLHLQGFSTLTNAEAYLQTQLLAILKHFDFENNEQAPCNYFTAQKIIGKRVEKLFGKSNDAIPFIMVTFKTSFANDFMMVKKLMKTGMNVARINCAHDNEGIWLRMIKTIREVSTFSNLPCKIYMDLAGPKLRTRIKGKKNRIEIEEEDIILLTDKKDIQSRLPLVECTIPGILAQLQLGEGVIFDDGLIETKIIGRNKDSVELEVIRVSSKKPYLKTEKSINFPDSTLQIPALSAFDRKCLPFIKEHADMVGYSFIHSATDLEELQYLLSESYLPIILKIETPGAMMNLPSLLFTAMNQEYYGVMIARGDLAVELGFENISEAQDEIISLCRAAHAPAIYATQILESMNKKGLPTRAEITDAAYGIWANCVMLNKGMHTARAVKALKKILSEKAKQFSGYHSIFRPLRTSKTFFEKYDADKIDLA